MPVEIPFLSGALFGNNLLNVSMMENCYQSLPPGPSLFLVYWRPASGHPTKNILLVSHSILQVPAAPNPLLADKYKKSLGNSAKPRATSTMGKRQSGCSVI